jgi:hypothetical protein
VVAAGAAAKRILGSYPDFGKAPAGYGMMFADALAHLTEEELAVVMDPRTGITASCEFLPSVGEVHALLREWRERKSQFAPAPTSYRRLNDEKPGPWDMETDAERKKRVVRELLGYDPEAKGAPVKRDLVPPTAEDLANLKLKTPIQPITRQLYEKLKAEGWAHLPGQRAADAA